MSAFNAKHSFRAIGGARRFFFRARAPHLNFSINAFALGIVITAPLAYSFRQKDKESNLFSFSSQNLSFPHVFSRLSTIKLKQLFLTNTRAHCFFPWPFSNPLYSNNSVNQNKEYTDQSQQKYYCEDNIIVQKGAFCAHQNSFWGCNPKEKKKIEEIALFSGSSNKPLAELIAKSLGIRLGQVLVERFADGEVSLKFIDSLRGKDVFLIQATSPPVNEHLVELLLMISTSRRSSAKRITAVMPYYGYARQDRKQHSRVPISAADVARMVETMGVDRVVSVDLHCGQIQGFFGPHVPVDNLEAQIIGLDYFAQKTLEKPIIVSPDAGGVYRARKFQEGLQKRGLKETGIAMLIKQRLRANEIEQMDLVGQVEGCDCIIVDDMIDTAGTLCEAASQLKNRGAKRVYAFATHGLFSGPALERLQSSDLEEIVVSDSILQKRETLTNNNKIKLLSIAPLIAEAIWRIHYKKSLRELFPE